MRAALFAAASAGAFVTLDATTAFAQRALPVAPPSRVDSLVARGRLRAAEDALYRAVDSNPYAPQARGELGRYLASRARFIIADVLFAEALRFGADTSSVTQAMRAIAVFRPEVDRRRIPGLRLSPSEAAREAARIAARSESVALVHTAVLMMFSADGRTIGRFEVRGAGGVRTAVLDPFVQGIALANAADSALTPRSFGATGAGAPLLIPELYIGDQRLVGVEGRVDVSVPEGEVRIGLDVLWSLQPVFDERAGMLRLSPERKRPTSTSIQIPFALAFPGAWLVPVVGEPPIAIASVRGRRLLRASRWWWNGPDATIVVDR